MILNALPGVGPFTAKKLIAHFCGHAARIFSATANQLKEIKNLDHSIIEVLMNYTRYFDLAREEDALESLRGRFLGLNDDNYPALLRNIPDAPIGIYIIGEVSTFDKNIAIVGSRTNTLYGLQVARALALELACRGFCIVSGMARGIDSSAHEGAIAAKGQTIAVLGNGVDIVYPAENSPLYRRIAENGALISEFTLGRRADKQTFPIRNRLIAGLCHAVIVVESDKHGGSMITARYANEYGRHVFAVPGRIDQPSSGGCFALIKEGATMLTCIDDIFEDLPYLGESPKQSVLTLNEEARSSATRAVVITCPVERKIYEILAKEKPMTADSVTMFADLPIISVLNALQMLEIRGFVTKRYDGLYEAKII